MRPLMFRRIAVLAGFLWLLQPWASAAEVVVRLNMDQIERATRNRLATPINSDGNILTITPNPLPAKILDLCRAPGRISTQFDFRFKGKLVKVPFSVSGNADMSFELALDSTQRGIVIRNVKIAKLNLKKVHKVIAQLLAKASNQLLLELTQRPILPLRDYIESISPKLALETSCSGVDLVF